MIGTSSDSMDLIDARNRVSNVLKNVVRDVLRIALRRIVLVLK